MMLSSKKIGKYVSVFKSIISDFWLVISDFKNISDLSLLLVIF